MTASRVFEDSFALIEQDRVVDGELRWQTLGLASENLLLMVAHTIEPEGEDEVVRIISARKASRKEQERYDENRAEEPPRRSDERG